MNAYGRPIPTFPPPTTRGGCLETFDGSNLTSNNTEVGEPCRGVLASREWQPALGRGGLFSAGQRLPASRSVTSSRGRRSQSGLPTVGSPASLSHSRASPRLQNLPAFPARPRGPSVRLQTGHGTSAPPQNLPSTSTYLRCQRGRPAIPNTRRPLQAVARKIGSPESYVAGLAG